MPRIDQTDRQLILLRKLESSRLGLTLEQLADERIRRQLAMAGRCAWTGMGILKRAENLGAEYRANSLGEGPPMSQPCRIMGGADECSDKEAAMRDIALLTILLVLPIATSHAEPGFDPRYERDYNIFVPTNQYAPDNPLNPVNQYDPDSAVNPVNRYDPGNPLNPVNRYSPNNPFNPVNQYHPDNPLNPANKYNSDVPFAPLDGGRG